MTKTNNVFIFTLLLSLLNIFFLANVIAQERPKASVSIVFINNAKTTYDDELTNKISYWLNGKVYGLYNIVPSEQPLANLRALGIDDITTVEKKDLIDAFGSNGTDYIIYAELRPFIRKEKITLFTYGKDMTATMLLKILDVPNGKYLYNGKFIIKASDSTSEWHIGNKSVALKAIDSVLVEMGEVISFRLPLQPPN